MVQGIATPRSNNIFQEHSGYPWSSITQYVNSLNKIGLQLISWFVRNESAYLQKYIDSQRNRLNNRGCWIVAKRRRDLHLGPRSLFNSRRPYTRRPASRILQLLRMNCLLHGKSRRCEGPASEITNTALWRHLEDLQVEIAQRTTRTLFTKLR